MASAAKHPLDSATLPLEPFAARENDAGFNCMARGAPTFLQINLESTNPSPHFAIVVVPDSQNWQVTEPGRNPGEIHPQL